MAVDDIVKELEVEIRSIEDEHLFGRTLRKVYQNQELDLAQKEYLKGVMWEQVYKVINTRYATK